MTRSANRCVMFGSSRCVIFLQGFDFATTYLGLLAPWSKNISSTSHHLSNAQVHLSDNSNKKEEENTEPKALDKFCPQPLSGAWYAKQAKMQKTESRKPTSSFTYSNTYRVPSAQYIRSFGRWQKEYINIESQHKGVYAKSQKVFLTFKLVPAVVPSSLS